MIAFLSSSQGSHMHASASGVWTWPAHGTARQRRIVKSRALRSFLRQVGEGGVSVAIGEMNMVVAG